MRIIKFFSKLLICVLCALCLSNISFAAGNVPYGDVGEYGNWLTVDNMEKYNADLSGDVKSFQQTFQTNLHSTNFVPVEVKLGLVFMKALSSIDYVLQISLVRFVIWFLFVMYAFWIGLEAYRMIRDSADYKAVLYDIFIKGFTIAIWVIVLEIGPAKLFTILITPILSLGVYLSDFILDAVAQTYNVVIPDTCATIHQYVDANTSEQMLINADAAANIMCLPGRLSVYFYHATASAFEWMINGFGHSATMVIVGLVCAIMFIGCIFKYAFMTLGVVADLFLTLLMLPFTALAESMPGSKESNYAGQIFSGLLGVFNTQKLSSVISKFINAAIYFVSLAIVIAICAALLTNIVSISKANTYTVGSAMTMILCGALVFYLAGKTDDLVKSIGGEINNSFGKQLQNDTKTLWNNVKGVGTKVFNAWLKKK
ncbi:MAG: hypothetical protein IKF41_02100 [Alphaproteobacteria bacterium]|nr:hypothetical protein [Alphaproteobacteria bacterium]